MQKTPILSLTLLLVFLFGCSTITDISPANNSPDLLGYWKTTNQYSWNGTAWAPGLVINDERGERVTDLLPEPAYFIFQNQPKCANDSNAVFTDQQFEGACYVYYADGTFIMINIPIKGVKIIDTDVSGKWKIENNLLELETLIVDDADGAMFQKGPYYESRTKSVSARATIEEGLLAGAWDFSVFPKTNDTSGALLGKWKLESEERYYDAESAWVQGELSAFTEQEFLLQSGGCDLLLTSPCDSQGVNNETETCIPYERCVEVKGNLIHKLGSNEEVYWLITPDDLLETNRMVFDSLANRWAIQRNFYSKIK